MAQYCAFVAAMALLPAVAARRGGGGGISVTVDTSNFHPPPIEAAKLAAYCIFLFVAIIQLEIFFTVARRPGPRRIPAAGATAALSILGIAYVLGIAVVGTTYTVDDDGFPRISAISADNLYIAYSLFYTWTDPAFFAAVAIVLYSRYRTVQKLPAIALIPFAGVLFVLMVTFEAAADGVLISGYISDRNQEINEFLRQIRVSNGLFYTFVAFSTIGTIFLTVAACFVKAHTHKDTVTSLTLFGIVPFLILRAIAQFILVIVEAVVGVPGHNFATILLYGLAYIGVTSVLAFLLARPQLWDAASSAQLPGQASPADTLRGQTEAKSVAA